MPEKKSYDRRNEESDSQWLGFLAYRDLGLGRTVEAAWVEYCKKRYKAKGESGKAKSGASGSFNKWVHLHDWPDRARDWDIDEEARQRELVIAADSQKYIAQLSEFRETQVNSGKAGVAIGLSIKNKMAKFLTDYKPQTIVDVERLARILAIVEKSGDSWGKALGIEQLLERLKEAQKND